MTFLCLFRLFLLSRHQKRTAQKTSRNVQRQKPVETVSPKSQSKRSAPKVSRNDQPQKPGDTISPKSQSTRSAPKARQHDQPQKPGFGCPRPNFRRRKTKDLCAICESIWASDLQHNSRTLEELCRFARVPSRSFFGVNLPMEGPILEGPRGQKAREK